MFGGDRSALFPLHALRHRRGFYYAFQRMSHVLSWYYVLHNFFSCLSNVFWFRARGPIHCQLLNYLRPDAPNFIASLGAGD